MSHYIELNGTSGLFTCKLDKVYRLEGEWQVALIQIELAKEWKIDIEHRPKLQSNPEYYKTADTQKINEMIDIKESNEEKQQKLMHHVSNMINVELLKYRYNSEMEYIVNYIEAEMTKITHQDSVSDLKK